MKHKVDGGVCGRLGWVLVVVLLALGVGCGPTPEDQNWKGAELIALGKFAEAQEVLEKGLKLEQAGLIPDEKLRSLR